MMELARSVGHERAHELVTAVSARVSADGLTLAAALSEDVEISAHLSQDDIDRLTEPSGYLGLAAAVASAAASRAGAASGVAS
jgi:3-carboxy-cis,cis-muconate cycloisomerase